MSPWERVKMTNGPGVRSMLSTEHSGENEHSNGICYYNLSKIYNFSLFYESRYIQWRSIRPVHLVLHPKDPLKSFSFANELFA